MFKSNLYRALSSELDRKWDEDRGACPSPGKMEWDGDRGVCPSPGKWDGDRSARPSPGLLCTVMLFAGSLCFHSGLSVKSPQFSVFISCLVSFVNLPFLFLCLFTSPSVKSLGLPV